MPRPNAGDDSNPRSGEGGPRRTPAQLAADPAFTTTYAKADPLVSITYNTDGTVATVIEDGITTAFTYNADGSVATTTRSGTTHTYSYTAGNLTGVA